MNSLKLAVTCQRQNYKHLGGGAPKSQRFKLYNHRMFSEIIITENISYNTTAWYIC